MRKSRKQIVVITVLLFLCGNISLMLEISYVDDSYDMRKLLVSGNASKNVSIFQHYPLDIDLANVVNELILHNKSIQYNPINSYFFQYIHAPIPCAFTRVGDERHSILIVVKSHVLNTNQRLAIRHVWKDARDKRVRLVFLLGTYSLEGEQWRIEKEVKLYGDIVQGHFVDSYDRVTYKILMGFDWISRHCTQADYLLFLDDDYYVYPTEMLILLRHLPKQQDTFIGKVIKKQLVKRISAIQRSPKFSHYTFKEIPTYVSGGSYVMSRETAHKFHIAFSYVRYFEIDDIYFGIVAQKLGVHPQHDARFDTSSPLALAFECSHYAPRLLRGVCPLAGRRREHPSVVPHVTTAKVDTFWLRLWMLPQIIKSAAKQTVLAFV